MEFWNFFRQKINNSVAGGAMVIAIFSILAKLAGLLRDRMLASEFGAGDILDAYYAAFRLPDLIFNTLILGALSAAFIPVFISLKSLKNKNSEILKTNNKMGEAVINFQANKEEVVIENQEDILPNSFQGDTEKKGEIKNGISHWQLASAMINIIFLALAGIAAIIFILSDWLVPIITPGFGAEKMFLTIQLTKIMLASILFFGVSNVIAGILQASQKFVMFSVAPLTYNLGIILGIVFAVPVFGPIGLGYGVVAGAVLHLLVQAPAAVKLGFHWQPILKLKNEAVRQVGRLMIPRTIGLGGNQLAQLVITMIASTMVAGSLAIYYLAFNLVSVPVGIFAVSIAIASFPALSESFAKGDKNKYIARFSISVRRILYLIVPVSIFIIALRAQLVRLVLGAGQFDWEDTILTADSLGFFAISLFAQGLIPLLMRAFYALKNTKTPVIISIVGILLNIILAILLGRELGVVGLSIAFSVATIVQLILLVVILRNKLETLDGKKVITATMRIAVATIGSLFFIQAAKYLIGSAVDMQTYFGVLVQFLGAAGSGVLSYLVLSYLVGSEEIKEVYTLIRNQK